MDLSSAAVDEVKVPRQWDDSFAAFNQVLGESGLSLADYKGKTVEKWTALCPALSDGETDTYCVLLVFKPGRGGASLLKKPPGAVTGLFSAAEPRAEPAEAEAAAETAATLDESVFPTE